MCLENALISYISIRAEKDKAKKLLQLSAMISNELDTMRLLPRVVDLTTQLLNSDRASIFVMDEWSGTLGSLHWIIA